MNPRPLAFEKGELMGEGKGGKRITGEYAQNTLYMYENVSETYYCV